MPVRETRVVDRIRIIPVVDKAREADRGLPAAFARRLRRFFKLDSDHGVVRGARRRVQLCGPQAAVGGRPLMAGPCHSLDVAG